MNTRRSRGRGNPRGGRHPNFRNQQLDSNGPEGRIRGTANQIHDRYLVLARDAQAVGDTVLAENLLQHAEHYFRVMSLNGTANPQNQFGAPRAPGEEEMRDDEEGFEPPQPGQREPGRRDEFGRDDFRREGQQREGFQRDNRPRDGFQRGGQQRDQREGYQRDQREGYQREGQQRDQREGYQRDQREGYQREHREGQQREQREGYQRDQREGHQRDRYQRDQREGYQRDQREAEAGARQPRAEGGPPPRPQPEQPGYSRREFGGNGPDVLPRRLREPSSEAEPRRAREDITALPSFLAPPPQSGNGADIRGSGANGGRPADDRPVRQSYAPEDPGDDSESRSEAAAPAEDNIGRVRRRRETGEASGEPRARTRRRRPAGEDASPAEGSGGNELPQSDSTS